MYGLVKSKRVKSAYHIEVYMTLTSMAFCSTGPLNEKLSSMFNSRIFTRLSIPAFSTHECACNGE